MSRICMLYRSFELSVSFSDYPTILSNHCIVYVAFLVVVVVVIVVVVVVVAVVVVIVAVVFKPSYFVFCRKDCW